MRSAYAHTAELDVAPDADRAAPGAAVTAALGAGCPGPVALRTGGTGDRLRLRVVFACEADDEDDVRRRIDQALTSGRLTGPDGSVSRWTLRDALPGSVAECERAEAERLLATT
ncbi:hypothetical protein GCM10009836_39770 [Pseudonocardia ailaonensis]|uniref:Uncharacterized protein n=1 Tax=Pseudonocardia ailaonensis TaxID=367279 RepID=A0ABN2N6Z4_9PSEU